MLLQKNIFAILPFFSMPKLQATANFSPFKGGCPNWKRVRNDGRFQISNWDKEVRAKPICFPPGRETTKSSVKNRVLVQNHFFVVFRLPTFIKAGLWRGGGNLLKYRIRSEESWKGPKEITFSKVGCFRGYGKEWDTSHRVPKHILIE